MISIWPKRKMSPTMEQVLQVPIDVVPALEPYDPDKGQGRAFNLILMVKEHAPRRREEITKEVAKLEKQLYDLGVEAYQLEALINALK